MDCVARVFKRLKTGSFGIRLNRLPQRKRCAAVCSPAVANTRRRLVPTFNTFHNDCGQIRQEAQP